MSRDMVYRMTMQDIICSAAAALHHALRVLCVCMHGHNATTVLLHASCACVLYYISPSRILDIMMCISRGIPRYHPGWYPLDHMFVPRGEVVSCAPWCNHHTLHATSMRTMQHTICLWLLDDVSVLLHLDMTTGIMVPMSRVYGPYISWALALG